MPDTRHRFPDAVSPKFSGRIVAARIERMTSADTSNSSPTAKQQSVFLQTSHKVFAATGMKPTVVSQKRADKPLVGFDQKYRGQCRNLKGQRHDSYERFSHQHSPETQFLRGEQFDSPAPSMTFGSPSAEDSRSGVERPPHPVRSADCRDISEMLHESAVYDDFEQPRCHVSETH